MSDSARKSKTGSVSGVETSRKRKPDWADGLKNLYNSVVDEPLPDSIKDLLAKLDDRQQ